MCYLNHIKKKIDKILVQSHFNHITQDPLRCLRLQLKPGLWSISPVVPQTLSLKIHTELWEQNLGPSSAYPCHPSQTFPASADHNTIEIEKKYCNN